MLHDPYDVQTNLRNKLTAGIDEQLFILTCLGRIMSVKHVGIYHTHSSKPPHEILVSEKQQASQALNNMFCLTWTTAEASESWHRHHPPTCKRLHGFLTISTPQVFNTDISPCMALKNLLIHHISFSFCVLSFFHNRAFLGSHASS